MNKTRLLVRGGTRMIAKGDLHRPSHDLHAERLVMPATTTKLAVKVAPASANKPVVSRHKSEWGDSAKADRRGRDIAAARAEARREAQPLQPIKPLFR
jgi:hypothetical protein